MNRRAETHFWHWSCTHRSRAFLAERRKRVWIGDALCETGLPRTGVPGAESTLDRESKDEDRDPNESMLANSSICRKSQFFSYEI